MNKIIKNNDYVLPVIIFACAYLLASIIPNLVSYFVTYPTINTYYVEGRAEKKITSDKAVISVTIRYHNTKDYQANKNIVLGYNPTLTAVYSEKSFGDKNIIVIENSDVHESEKLCASINNNQDQLEDARCSVKYFYSNINNLKDQMLTEAAINARIQAEGIASTGRVRIDELTSADTTAYDSFTVIPTSYVSDEVCKDTISEACYSYNNTYNSGYANPYDTTSIEKIVTAKVKANFSVK